MTMTIERQTELTNFVEQSAKELYPESEWSKAAQQGFLEVELNFMKSAVFEHCYDQRPDLFDGIYWINSDTDFPLWVRPGCDDEWYEHTVVGDDDDDLDDED